MLFLDDKSMRRWQAKGHTAPGASWPRLPMTTQFNPQFVPRSVIHIDALATLKIGKSFVKHATQLDLGDAGLVVDAVGELDGVDENEHKYAAQVEIDVDATVVPAQAGKCSLS